MEIKKEDQHIKVFMLKLPIEVHRRIKIESAKTSKDMTDIIIELITTGLEIDDTLSE